MARKRYRVSTVLYVEGEADDIFGVVPVVDRVMQDKGLTEALELVGFEAVRLTYDSTVLPE